MSCILGNAIPRVHIASCRSDSILTRRINIWTGIMTLCARAIQKYYIDLRFLKCYWIWHIQVMNMKTNLPITEQFQFCPYFCSLECRQTDVTRKSNSTHSWCWTWKYMMCSLYVLKYLKWLVNLLFLHHVAKLDAHDSSTQFSVCYLHLLRDGWSLWWPS